MLTATVKVRRALWIIFVLILLLTLFLFVRRFAFGAETAATAAPKTFSAATEEQRLAFLTQYGFSVEKEPVEIREVLIPTSFEGLYSAYEALQQRQGLSLENFRGKTLRRYAYRLSKGEGIAELLIADGRIVACDLYSEQEKDFQPIIS